jgi:hypothetical protein
MMAAAPPVYAHHQVLHKGLRSRRWRHKYIAVTGALQCIKWPFAILYALFPHQRNAPQSLAKDIDLSCSTCLNVLLQAGAAPIAVSAAFYLEVHVLLIVFKLFFVTPNDFTWFILGFFSLCLLI